MFKPIACYLGFKYLFTASHDKFISFVSSSAIIGLSLGVAVLITVCSVMNGLNVTMHDRLGNKLTTITVNKLQGAIDNWKQVRGKLVAVPGVVSVAPYIDFSGALYLNDTLVPVNVYGIYSNNLRHFSVNNDKNFTIDKFTIIVKNSLKTRSVADKVTLILPKLNANLFSAFPIMKRFTLSDLEVNASDEVDCYINIDAASVLLNQQAIKKLSVIVNDADSTYGMVHRLQQILGKDYLVFDWTYRYKALFKAIAMEKTMMTIVLTLIIIMACFNLLSSLVMLVNDKEAEIAILKTIGMTRSSIMAIFVTQGVISGVIGSILGSGLGFILSVNIGRITSFIEGLIGRKLVSADVYWVDTLPSEILFSDIISIITTVLLLSLLATIYPALKAAGLQPSKVLRAIG